MSHGRNTFIKIHQCLNKYFNNHASFSSLPLPFLPRFRNYSNQRLEPSRKSIKTNPILMTEFPTYLDIIDGCPHTRFQAHIRNIIPLLKTEGARLYLALFPEKKKGFQSTFYSNWPKKWEARANIQYSSSYPSCQQAKRNFRFCG